MEIEHEISFKKYLQQKEKLKKCAFFSASSISRKFFTARCKALTTWFLFQNDANLYLTLPGNGMRSEERY